MGRKRRLDSTFDVSPGKPAWNGSDEKAREQLPMSSAGCYAALAALCVLTLERWLAAAVVLDLPVWIGYE